MSRSSPTAKHRPVPLPKTSSSLGSAEASSPGSPTLKAKKPAAFYPYPPSSPKTPPRSPLGQSKFVHCEKARALEPITVLRNTFGSCLHSTREQIYSRHERELQALECFRGYVHKRAKAEGEYAAALAKINGNSMREMAGLVADSPIVQVWNGVLETFDTIQKKHCSTSKHVEETLLGTIDQLVKEKRELMKTHNISCYQLDNEYRTSCSEVQSLRRDYFHLLEVTENTKRKLEDTLKRPNAKPDEIDKLRGKYAKVAQQLHTAHNDYILSLLNVNCHMKHYNTSMLPFCLNALQEKMELFVSEWKEVMEEYALTARDMSKVYQESYDTIATTLDKLKPEQEYTALIQENKSDPLDEENYVFDMYLLQHLCSPKVEPTKMSVNNLTHERLVCELAAMERRLEEFMKEQSEKVKKLEGLKAKIVTEEKTCSQMPKTTLVLNLQAELKSLECKIERQKIMLARVKEDIDELQISPAPLFDQLGDGIIVTADYNLPRDRHNSLGSGDSSGKVIKTKPKLKGLMTWINQRSHSQSNENIPLQVEAEIVQGKDIDDDNDDVQGHVHAKTFHAGVESETWFYPNMERNEAELKCRKTGDYLVRFSSKQNRYILTVNWAGQGRHFIIQEQYNDSSNVRMYYFESDRFTSICALLDFHVNSKKPITMVSGAILINPVRNDNKWLVTPEEIEKIRDLGKGAFGEVYESEWKGQRVAVKSCHFPYATEKDKYFQMLEVMKYYDHPNIIKFIGYCWNAEPIIVMELMTGGSLVKYLKKCSGILSGKKLLQISMDVCCGMKYLETKSCIHGNLSVKNCFVGENDIVKISDFGEYELLSSKQVSYRWTAPEALKTGQPILASDIWSFGVLLWEVFSGGALPYSGMSHVESKIDQGYRMPCPMGCPEAMHDVMMLCWQYEPQERPNFSDLNDMLKDLKETINK